MRFPTRKHYPGYQSAVLPRCQRCWACAADFHLGSPVGTFFGHKASQCVCTVAVQPLCRHFVPKVGPKTPQGGPKVPKRSPKAHFSEPQASLLGAIAATAVLCKNISIYYGLATLSGSGRLPFRTHSRLGNAMCTTDALFHVFRPTFGAKVTPKVAPREPQGRPKGPQGAPKPPPGRLKTIKKSTWDPTWAPKGVWEAPGVPPRRKRSQKSTKKRYFCTAPGRLANTKALLRLPLYSANPLSAAAERSSCGLTFGKIP